MPDHVICLVQPVMNDIHEKTIANMQSWHRSPVMSVASGPPDLPTPNFRFRMRASMRDACVRACFGGQGGCLGWAGERGCIRAWLFVCLFVRFFVCVRCWSDLRSRTQQESEGLRYGSLISLRFAVRMQGLAMYR